jgi:hypothetical protein
LNIAESTAVHARSQICGMESAGYTDPDKQKQLLIDHINKIRTQPAFANCTMVVIPEANLGLEAAHITKYLRESTVPNWCILREDRMNLPGVRTTADNKEAMCIRLQDLLRSDGVGIARDLVCVDEDSNAADQVQSLMQQLMGYSIMVKKAETVFQKTKIVFTGKISGKQDDLCMALQMMLFWSGRFWRTPERYSGFY